MDVIKTRILELRERVGLSQNKLGKLCGLPQSSINRYSKDNRSYYRKHSHVGISVDDIIGSTSY